MLFLNEVLIINFDEIFDIAKKLSLWLIDSLVEMKAASVILRKSLFNPDSKMLTLSQFGRWLDLPM